MIVTLTFLITMGGVNGVTTVFLIYSLAEKHAGSGWSGLWRITRNGSLQEYRKSKGAESGEELDQLRLTVS
jgi:hypothetical protein